MVSPLPIRLLLMTLPALLLAGTGRAAEADPSEQIATALAACDSMQERFTGTVCTATPVGTRAYRVIIRAATPDAMRVVFMRSLDVADGLCRAGLRVDLDQELETSAGARAVRWRIAPPDCAIKRLEDPG